MFDFAIVIFPMTGDNNPPPIPAPQYVDEAVTVDPIIVMFPAEDEPSPDPIPAPYNPEAFALIVEFHITI
jgi:hypothetical protein